MPELHVLFGEKKIYIVFHSSINEQNLLHYIATNL